MVNKYLSPLEAAIKNWFSKYELRTKFRLKPAKGQRIVGTVWQGQGTYYVYDKSQCVAMRKYREPTEKQLEALKVGRTMLGTKECVQCKGRFDTYWRGKFCPDCQDKSRINECINTAKKWLEAEAYTLDTETTGLGDEAEIVEICLIDAAGTPLLNTLIQPLKPIPDEAIEIHGITNEMVAGASTWAEIHEQFASLIAGKTVVIYNAEFDVRMIEQTAEKHGLVAPEVNAVCAMETYAEFWGSWDNRRNSYSWQRLGYAAKQQGVIVEGQAHRAFADCLMTLGIVRAMAATPTKTIVCKK